MTVQKVFSILLIIITAHIMVGQECLDVNATTTNGQHSVLIDCDFTTDGDVCIDLQVEYTEVASTEDYYYEAISYNPVIPFDEGTSLIPTLPNINGIVDDKFSDIIPLGFTFCFYDQSFTDIVIGTNGILTFNLDEANAEPPAGISNTNPNPSLIDNAIFAVQHDLVFDINDDSGIFYSTTGTAPCRQFIVNYYNAQVFGCDERSTVQIILHEFTNEIEVHIKDKPLACDNGRDNNSLLGIMNGDGTLGISPPNRNTGIWSAQNEAWLFAPNGTQSPEIVWFDDSGTQVGTGSQITVCPIVNTVYTAQVQYQSCVGNTLFGSDEIVVNYATDYPVVENYTVYVCDAGNDGQELINFNNYNEWISLNDTNNLIFNYYSTLTDAQRETNPLSSDTIFADTVYYVRITNTTDNNCFTITPITFSFTAAEINNLLIQLCDNNNDGVESDVNLIPYVDSILNGISYQNYTIYSSSQDAENQFNPIAVADLSSNSQFWLHLNITEDCEQIIGPININFFSAPPVRNVEPIVFDACDINFNHDEPFDWETEIPQILDLSSGETFSVHTSYNGAEENTGTASSISDNINPYYVRISNRSGCYTILEVPVEVTFYGVEATSITDNICFDGTEDISVNLNDYLEEMLIDPLTGVDISLYATNADAVGHVTENIIDPEQTITEDGHNVETSFYVRFQISEECYTVRRILIRLVHPIPMANPIEVCDIFNDNNEENDLSIYDSYILGDQTGTVSYYLTENDALANSNQLITYQFTQNITLFVRIESYGCAEIYPITFQLTSVLPTRNLTITLGEICDTNNNGLTEIDLTNFESDIYTGSDNVDFLYFLNYDPLTQTLSNPIDFPNLFSVTESFTFYVQVVEENVNCNAVSQINLIIDFGQPFEISPTELFLCDFQFDLNEEFNLTEAIPSMSTAFDLSDTDLYSVSFYTSMEDLENEVDAVGPIFTPNSSNYIIYVKVTHQITGCSAINTLTLYTVAAPKATKGEIGVCDNNINGAYDLDLTLLNPIVMSDDTDAYVYSYHLSEEDAINDVNPLDASTIYEADPFPPIIWVRVESALIETCFDAKFVEITFNSLTQIDNQDLYRFSCDIDNDGYSNFDLTFIEDYFPSSQYQLTYYENLSQVNNFEDPIENPANYINSIANSQNVIVVIQEGTNCPIYANIELEVIPTPRVNLETTLFCPGTTTDIVPELLSQGSTYSFEWMNSANEVISTDFILTDVGTEDTYTLWVTDVNFPECKTPFPVDLIAYESPVIQSIIAEGTTATVMATGAYPIEYSMDGIHWQSSNNFANLADGPHTFWVRYIEQGCLGEPKRGLILNIPNVITPNGDGYNDYITIDDLDVFNEEEAKFQIYDRYGKLIFEESSNTSITWDGKFHGRVLNTTDYWYELTLPDGRIIRGSITVKNY